MYWVVIILDVRSLASPTWKKHICAWSMRWDVQRCKKNQAKNVVTVMLICNLVGFGGKSSSSLEGIKCNRPSKNTNVCHKEFIILFNILSKKEKTHTMLFLKQIFHRCWQANSTCAVFLIQTWMRHVNSFDKGWSKGHLFSLGAEGK